MPHTRYVYIGTSSSASIAVAWRENTSLTLVGPANPLKHTEIECPPPGVSVWPDNPIARPEVDILMGLQRQLNEIERPIRMQQ